MKNTIPIRTGRHVVFTLHAHLVFVAKYRKTVFSKDMLERMQAMFSKVCNDFTGTLEEFEDEIGRYYWKGVLWTPSYFAGSCGGAPLNIIREYIQQQQTPS